MANNGKPDRLDRIDNVLARLAERHEALAISLKRIGRELKAKRIASLADGENLRQLIENSKTLRDSIKSLEAIALGHQQRLDNLENR